MGEPLSNAPAFPPALTISVAGPPPAGGIMGAVTRALGLSGTGDVRSGDGLTLSGRTLRAADLAAFARALQALSAPGLQVRLEDAGAQSEAAPDLDHAGLQGDSGHPALRTDLDRIDITITVVNERLVRQVMRLGGTCIETTEATPEAMIRRRRPPPDVGSPELRALLGAAAYTFPPAPPPPNVPAPLRDSIEAAVRLGRALVWGPGTPTFAFGLFQLDEMVKPMRVCAMPRAVPAEDAGPLVVTTWPFYRWGPLHLVHIGWAPDFTSYYLDETGCVWSYDPTQDELDLSGGSPLTWLEGFAPGDEARHPRASESLFFPMGTPGELPAAFGATRIARKSSERMAIWASETYTFSESIPALGVPLVEVRARANDDLVAVLRWARRTWGTRKMALIWMPPADVLERAAAEEGVEIVDGAPSSWKPASFWEDAPAGESG